MTRAVLLACLPWVAILLGSMALLWFLVRLNHAGFQWRRLLLLHADEGGSAQALSFVLTLPIFMWVMMFIVQVSQLMIATIAVNYAAFAAARAAIVWIPANIAGVETENCISGLVPTGQAQGGDTYSVNATPGDPKYAKIQMAAALALMGVSPSRDLGLPVPQEGESAQGVLTAAYDALAPNSLAPQAVSRRLGNKLAYALDNTVVEISVFHPCPDPPSPGSDPALAPYDLQPYPAEFVPGQEIGWQDAITVTVTYQMALLPGAGRLLSVGNANITTDGAQGPASQGMQVYKYQLSASATLGNEGEKSVAPYLYNN
ncbi:MAG: hypothetical protein ACLQNE_46255 [Thermoguttaceae bacterium]